jgi:hypothetical protein
VITTRLIANAPPLSKSSVFCDIGHHGVFTQWRSISKSRHENRGYRSGP